MTDPKLTDEQIANCACNINPYPLALVQVPAEQIVAFVRNVERALATREQTTSTGEPIGWIVDYLLRDGRDERGREFHWNEDRARESFAAWQDNPRAQPRIYPLFAAPIEQAKSGEEVSLREALAELVACKDLADRIENWDTDSGRRSEVFAMMDEYKRRKPLAWEAARRCLDAAGPEHPAVPSGEEEK